MRAHMKKSVVLATKIVVALAAIVAMLLMLLPSGSAAPAATATASTSLASNKCTRSCGDIIITYPFGIESGCYHAAGFNLTCDDYHYDPPKLFLGDSTMEVLAISIENGTVRINSSPAISASYMSPGMGVGRTWAILPQGGPFFLSESRSSVALVGCGVQVEVLGGDDNSLVASCVAVCPLNSSGGMVLESTMSNRCAGVGCCLANIVVGYDSYSIMVSTLNERVSGDGGPASAFFVDQGFSYTGVDIGIHGGYPPEALPTVATLEWVISNGTCPSTRQNGTILECCSTHSVCLEVSNNIANRGYRCACADGYQGNPYIIDGCQDIDECKSPDIYHCYGNCSNTPGSFTCQCPAGFTGNASFPNGCKDIDECKHQEAYSCYGSNSKQTIQSRQEA